MSLLKHVLESQQFAREDLMSFFGLADTMETVVKQGGSSVLQGQIMATLFYEPSTRTRLSFEAAMQRLGGNVLGTENAREFSSAVKGETLEDSIRVISGYADIIVMRHHISGSAKKAAAVSSIPIINAGDGAGQHPTQALLDIYTIQKELGRIDGMTIAMVGDLANGRTVRSLSYLLTRFNVKKIYFVAPLIVRMKQDIKDHLDEHQITHEEVEILEEILSEVDVIYQTRIQKERFGDRIDEYEQACGHYIIDARTLDAMKKQAIIMHPLPRVNEITTPVDNDKRAAYFRQAQNGLYIRMALLKLMLAPQTKL